MLFDGPPAKDGYWRALTALLLIFFAGLRLAWLSSSCSLDLAPDEAHYWDWSRHLDWSYYSKGPLIACLIRAGTLLVGPWAEYFAVNPALAVRWPALVCTCLLLVSLYLLTVQVFGQERLAFLVVALALTLPPIVALSTLMTIDAPYLCCWGWTLVLGHRAVFRASGWAWPLAGLVLGLGILAKYTMVLWLPSFALFLLTSPKQRHLLRRSGFWMMVLLAGLCSLPILVWNIRHDWITFKHVNTLAGLHTEAPPLVWHGPLTFVGTQFAVLLGFWFVGWMAAMVVHRPWHETNPSLRYLWWLSAPMFAVFLTFSLKTGGGEPNWPATTYLSGLVLMVGWLWQLLREASSWRGRLVRLALTTAAVLGVLVSLLLHFSDRTYPALGWLADRLYPGQELALRRLDPTCRLRGWQTLAAAVDELRAELRQEGQEPLLAACSWFLPGELGFYCRGNPQVYSIGLAQGDRRSQYDLWRPNPVADPEPFRGRTFIVVGWLAPEAEQAFEQVSPPRAITHCVGNRPVNSWRVTVCRGFRGFDPLPAWKPRY